MSTESMRPDLVATRDRAPLGRLLRSELRFMLLRPRTIIALAGLAAVPVIAAVSISIAAGSDGGGRGGEVEGIASMVAGNGMMLPILVLLLSLTMLLPLIGSMWAADAIAGESATGGLRNLYLAPVSRVRLLAIKAFGVATLSLLAVVILAVVSVLAGIVFLGGTELLTISGTTLPFIDSLGRVALLITAVTIQVWAVAAIALAISTSTDHPLVVLAAATGGIIVFSVLGEIPTLDWLHPLLITEGWTDIAAVARDPLPMDALTEGALRAACYLAIGYSLALARITTRDG